MSTQYEIFKHFNLTKRRDLVKGKTYGLVKELIRSALYDRSWIAFHGRIGSGKTDTIYTAIEDLRQARNRVEVVEVLSPDRQGIKISHVMNSIVYQLGEKHGTRMSPRRDMEARTRQVLRILSAARHSKYEVVLTIDEAHELHGNTLKAIKRLRDFRFMGEKELISVVMLGQPGLAAKLARDEELAPRCDRYEFAYTEAELVQIARHHSFDMLSTDDARTVAERFETPLKIKAGIYQALRKAYQIGADTIALKYFDFPEQREAPRREARKKITVDPEAAEKVNQKFKKAAS